MMDAQQLVKYSRDGSAEKLGSLGFIQSAKEDVEMPNINQIYGNNVMTEIHILMMDVMDFVKFKKDGIALLILLANDRNASRFQTSSVVTVLLKMANNVMMDMLTQMMVVVAIV